MARILDIDKEMKRWLMVQVIVEVFEVGAIVASESNRRDRNFDSCFFQFAKIRNIFHILHYFTNLHDTDCIVLQFLNIQIALFCIQINRFAI